MSETPETGLATPSQTPRRLAVYRHARVTRLTHWINFLCVSMLLFSGLQIFNAHPALYWGQFGADSDPSIFELGADESRPGPPAGFARIGSSTFETTGIFGLSRNASGEFAQRGFPAWLTLPSWRDLAMGRRWHFFFAWLFVGNLLVYVVAGLANGHLRRDLAPSRRQLRPGALLQDIVDHLRLKFPRGEEARHYNPLQKLTYLGVIGLLLPAMILTGLAMSPGMDAILPWLVDMFGGRQSARTIHFIAASLIVLFVCVHVAMVLLAGPVNELRSMITGRLLISVEDKHE
ncbi:cytochrome b/b6 domain-containing protein [Methylocapsa aurea]|uniref:cytochrome b/b6 domain-containing protein n=1 Tax=Methylocapsa aurea TaxID=663610 RepID=UPI00068CE1D5|nr:cytochrome b/b6 domain-containing protein [Methylocapsa aurea]